MQNHSQAEQTARVDSGGILAHQSRRQIQPPLLLSVGVRGTCRCWRFEGVLAHAGLKRCLKPTTEAGKRSRRTTLMLYRRLSGVRGLAVLIIALAGLPTASPADRPDGEKNPAVKTPHNVSF